MQLHNKPDDETWITFSPYLPNPLIVRSCLPISPSENRKGDDKICELKNTVTQTSFKNSSHDFATPVQDLN